MVHNQRGFTLIEILATLVIFVMVMAVISSFLIFTQRLFVSGSQQVNLHNDLRLAAEKVNRELRFAYHLELITEETFQNDLLLEELDYSYLFWDQDSNRLVILDESREIRFLSEDVISNVTFETNVSTLLFTLEGEGGGEDFSLSSSVRLLNYRCTSQSLEDPAAVRFSLNPEMAPE